MIITDQDLELAKEDSHGYQVGVTKDYKFVILTILNNNKPVYQLKLSDKESRMMARELNNARSHLKL